MMTSITILTGECDGYYQDYGSEVQLLRTFQEGFVYSGEYSRFKKRRHGTPSRDISPEHFVVFSQNHDQVGNRAMGERLSLLVSFEELKLAAGVVILSPYIPLLFMGEECAEKSPFLYFVSHSDTSVIDNTRKGRSEEFRSFGWGEEIPDPQDPSTFMRSKMGWCHSGDGKVMLEFYRKLLHLRKGLDSLSRMKRGSMSVEMCNNILSVRRSRNQNETLALFNLSTSKSRMVCEPRWRGVVDSAGFADHPRF